MPRVTKSFKSFDKAQDKSTEAVPSADELVGTSENGPEEPRKLGGSEDQISSERKSPTTFSDTPTFRPLIFIKRK